jgi:hypothetical protein
MNEIIKFRAWITKTNEMVGVFGIQFDDNSPLVNACIVDEHNDFHDLTDVVLMEYTGLTYVDAKYAYEGDLFRCDRDDVLYRIWKVKGGFAINTPCKRWQKDILLDYPFPAMPLADEQTASWFESNCYYVGNIFENKELMAL